MNTDTVNIETILAEYETKRDIYADYAATVERILQLLLKKNEIRYQKTESRAKDVGRLRKKLAKTENVGKGLFDITDLSGCRVIFHLEEDVSNFAQILDNEFDVVLDENKISEAGYNARHLDIRLKANRAELSEHSDFKGLVCEVQLTTTLYHAWSALYHDDMYKDTSYLRDFHRDEFERIDKHFQKAMHDYIRPASYQLSYVMGELDRLKQGKEILSSEFVQQRLLGSETLNALHSTLSLYKKAIEKFGEKKVVGQKAVEIIVDVIQRASELRDTTDTDFLWTATEESVIALALETLKPMRYYYCGDVIRLCIQYAAHGNEEISKKAKEIILETVDYDLEPLQAIGYYPQETVLVELEALSDNDLKARSVTVRECCEKLLKPTFDASRMTSHETLEIRTGPLNADEAHRMIRRRTIELLKHLFTVSDSLAERRTTLHAFSYATRTPANVKYPDELEQLVEADTISLCD